MAIKGSHSGCIVSTSSEMTPQESALKGVVNARATRSQIVYAIQVLQQLSRRIDNEAEDSIRLGGNWYLEAGRADWIATQGVQRMQAVDTDTAAPGTREALDQLCRTYWYPLYAYVRRRGHTPEDAQDLTQAFFVHFLQENSINQARYTAR